MSITWTVLLWLTLAVLSAVVGIRAAMHARGLAQEVATAKRPGNVVKKGDDYVPVSGGILVPRSQANAHKGRIAADGGTVGDRTSGQPLQTGFVPQPPVTAERVAHKQHVEMRIAIVSVILSTISTVAAIVSALK